MTRSVSSGIAPTAILVLVSTLVAYGCKKAAETAPIDDHYAGRFIFAKNPNVVGGTDTDLVQFTVVDDRYSILFTTSETKVCPTEGTAQGYGGNSVTLVPTALLGANCDSMHIPRGVFTSAFVGDSLYLVRFDTAQNMRYSFQLKK